MGGGVKAPRLRIASLRVVRGSFKLGPISLELGPGLHAILGPNGAGKTTFLESIPGVVKREGSISLAGVEIGPGNAWALVSTNFVLPPLGFAARVIDYARVYLSRATTEWESRATRVFKEMGVEELLWRRWEELSAGQRSLAAVLVALAKPAPLVLLDEPFTHLDPYWACRLERMLQMEARNRIILYSTHEFSTPRSASTVMLMREGRIIAHGSPDDVLQARMLEKLYGVEFEERNGLIRPVC